MFEKDIRPALKKACDHDSDAMHLDGANIMHQTKLANTSTTTAALTVWQLLVFNSVKHAHSVESTSVRHSRERETPLPLYLSLKIHAVTRSRYLQ